MNSKAKKISVALAAYNGEKYIVRQLESILANLGEGDEIIVSDDNPAGETVKAVQSLNDSRIKYVEGPGKGVVRNFENALKYCTGDIIFFSDQDDVWLENKVKRVTEEFDRGANLVAHNATITDCGLAPSGQSTFGLYGTNKSFIKNIVSNSFVGCCMALDRETLFSLLPFPGNVPMHDWYIAIKCILSHKKISLVDEELMLWRRHGDNVTGNKTSVRQKIRWRVDILKSLH